jgi:galactose mutarotase-like enzyme
MWVQVSSPGGGDFYVIIYIKEISLITGTTFKGLNALKIENDKLCVTVIPELGGKIASVFHKGKNFEFYFQHKEGEFSLPELYSDFAEFDASGFDDCFPSVDSCSVDINDRTVQYPDHGEIWSKSMSYEISGDVLILRSESVILPYTYEKRVSLSDDTLSLNYKITNNGGESFPCIWTMHGLLNCEDDMEIYLPRGTVSVISVQDSKVFGKAGAVLSYPEAVTREGAPYHLNKIKPVTAGKTEKFYVNGEITTGECGVYYPSKDLHCRIIFETDKLPYLGLWITEGGFRGDYNLALEPSTGFYDSIDIAERNGKLNMLSPGEELNLFIKIEYSNGGYPK